MHRFFDDTWGGSPNPHYALPPSEARHAARVLRLQPGDEFGLLNGRGDLGSARIRDIAARGDVVSCELFHAERQAPPIGLRLYIAPPKGRSMDLLLRMATELGVTRITPILCRYGVSRPDGSKEAWRSQLIVSCKQSGNPFLPRLDEPTEFSRALSDARERAFVGAAPRFASSPQTWPPADGRASAVWIGPEGGFTEEEQIALLSAGAIPVTVGSYILRVETAVPAMLSLVSSLG